MATAEVAVRVTVASARTEERSMMYKVSMTCKDIVGV
jgi:hypothetical protein